MTVDKALSQLSNTEHGDPWVADDFDAVVTLLRYVEQVREAEGLCAKGSIVQRRLAAAREGSGNDRG